MRRSRQWYIKQFKKLLEKIDVNSEEFFEAAVKIALRFLRHEITFDEFVDQIIDLIYKSLEKTMALTLAELREIYSKLQDIKEELKNMTFSEDGKTLEERIYNICQELYYDHISKEMFIYRLGLIFHNENRYLYQKIKQKAMPSAGLVVFFGCSCDKCSQESRVYPYNEVPAWPPFHVNCSGDWFEVETDDADDIHDLDLETE